MTRFLMPLKRVVLIFISLIYSFTIANAQENVLNKLDGNDILKAIMVSPKYRNALYPTMDVPDSIKVKVHISNGVFLSSSIIDVVLTRDGNTLKSWNFEILKSDMVLVLDVLDVVFENTRSAPYTKDDNPYNFKLVIKDNGVAKDSVNLELNKYPVPPTGVNEVRLDDNNNLLINGKHKIIYGAYLYHYNKSWYSYLEGIGLNGFAEWGSQVNAGYHSDTSWALMRSNKSDINNIDGVRQNIRNNRQKSQLLVYRTVDEPNSHGITPETVKKHYKAAREEDPYHPAVVVIKAKDHPAQHYSYTGYTDCADIFMLDLYPIYKDGRVTDGDIGAAHTNYEQLRDSKLGFSDWELEDIATFAAPQIFNQSHWRLPYNMESKNLFYQHIAGGARSFFAYSYEAQSGYNSAWEYYGKTLVPELKSIEEIIYAKEDNIGISISGANASRLVWSRRVVGNNEYLILINTSSKWNMLYSGKKKVIDMNITFKTEGSDNVEVVIGDATMPKTYTIEDGKLHVLLDGIDEISSGVIILKRNTIVSVEKEVQKLPIKYSLSQNYPNPFNPSTVINYTIPNAGMTKVEVFNILGQKVITLVNKNLEAGSHKVEFNASNLTSGIYFYKLQSNNFTSIKKMMLIK